MRKFILAVTLIFTVCRSGAQSIEQFVISPTGAFMEMGLFSISYTLAQSATQTVSSANNILTQGFQQPDDFISGISLITTPDFQISVYPNPVHDFLNLNIEGDNGHLVLLQIYNMLGAAVGEAIKVCSNTDNQLNLSSLVAGSYMVRVTTKNFSGAVRFIKTRN